MTYIQLYRLQRFTTYLPVRITTIRGGTTRYDAISSCGLYYQVGGCIGAIIGYAGGVKDYRNYIYRGQGVILVYSYNGHICVGGV